MSITNTVAAPALRGQGVKVTLDTDIQTTLDSLVIGQVVTVDADGNTGTVYSIDSFGNSFMVIPIQPDKRFDGITPTPGNLYVNDTITL
jgi:hypothetical protein